MATLLERKMICADESLAARVSQALLEAGKDASVASVVAGLVAASESGDLVKKLGPAITDEEIVAAVAAVA